MPNIEEIRETQRQMWNKFSSGWKKCDSFTMDWLRPVGEKLLELAVLKDDYILLDVATGTGEPGLTAAEKLKHGRVIGTDLAEEMIRIAEEKANERGVTNYETRVCDASELPFANDYFDAIVCRFGIMFFPDTLTGLKELVRVLKPRRRIAISAWAQPEKNPWATNIGEIVNSMLQIPAPHPDAPNIFRCSEPGTLTSLLNQAGLDDVKEIEISGKVTFDTPENYWEFMTNVAAPIIMALAKADEEMREKVRLAVLKSAMKHVNGGRLTMQWSSWIASGVKQPH